MAVSRCGKELKQAFDRVYKGFFAINGLSLISRNANGRAVESLTGSNFSESEALQSLFQHFRNRGRSSIVNKAEKSAERQYAFKQASGKGGTKSGKLFTSAFGIHGKSTFNHGFGYSVMRNVGQGKRFYYVDRYNVQHFRRRGPRKWIQNPQRVVIIVILGSGLVISIYYSNLETVPYSHRKHFILISKQMERQIGESQFQEVGHCVARHAAEGITRNLWFTIIQLIVLQFVGMPDVVYAMSNLLLKLPFSRRMEMEADYIGLLLMASAGYDPRIAPSVYEKLGQLGGDSVIKNYLSTHPSGKKRGEMLRQAQVMQEALSIYRQRIIGHGIEGFL